MAYASALKLALERRLKERIRRSFADDQVFSVRLDVRMNLPAFSANFERMPGFAVMP